MVLTNNTMCWCPSPPPQLLTPAMMLARTNGREEISHGDLTEIDELFHDAKVGGQP